MFLLICTVVISILSYIYLKDKHQYWKKRKIPYLQPTFLLGNAGNLCLGRKSMFDYHKELYESTSDFEYFCDRGVTFDVKEEPLTRHLFHMEGNEWKNLKVNLTPFFSNNAVKLMFPDILYCASEMNSVFISMHDKDVEIQEIMSRYATDIIGSCAFGINNHSLIDPSNEFYKMIKKIFTPRIKTILKLVFPRIPNILVELFDIRFIEKQISTFFISVIKTEISSRKCNQISKNDFLNSLLSLRSSQMQHDLGTNLCDIPHVGKNEINMNAELIAAQCFLFFSAGYENTISVLCFCLYELTQNVSIQDKVCCEIDTILARFNGSLCYEAVVKMTYLDMVISEILRKYPPASALVRVCNRDYKLPGYDAIIEKGVQVIIPIVGLHSDPRYYQEPHKFNPENFSKEAKATRPHYTYIPFGAGPRSCVGRTFSLIQIKTALISLLQTFEFLSSAKMKTPVKLEKKMFIATIEGGTWVRCRKRT